MNRSVVCVHTSPAAIAPVKNYFSTEAPSLRLTNLLDDGMLPMFAAHDYPSVEQQLLALISMANRVYGADAALLTCSAVPRDSMNRLRETSPIPVVKIDEPMADTAVRAGRKIGVLYTFAPTLQPTTTLLKEASTQAGCLVDLESQLVPAAYDALLAGRASEHDALVLEAARQLAPKVDVIVLAQVSMAHLAVPIEAGTSRRTLSGLSTSLAALRERIGGF